MIKPESMVDNQAAIGGVDNAQAPRPEFPEYSFKASVSAGSKHTGPWHRKWLSHNNYHNYVANSPI